MRHIPEEELHAYLDQALSRSQCVEIESHLAGCDACRAERDGIAALRDRTTALLQTLAPARRIPPSFEVLRTRQAARAARRQHRIRNAAWAASLLAALGTGWSMSFLQYGHPAPPAASSTVATASAPALVRSAAAARVEPAAAPADGGAGTPRGAPETTLAATGMDRSSSRTAASSAPRGEARQTAEPAPKGLTQHGAVEVSSSALPDSGSDLELSGMWRTVSLAGARDEAGELPPRIDGLPVMQVQVQKGVAGQKPLMVVAQQLQSGQTIRTIEGPAADVSSLLANRSGDGASSPWPTLQSSGNGSSFESRDGAMAMRYGDRILAITAPLPSDSLLAMIRRLNAELRTK